MSQVQQSRPAHINAVTTPRIVKLLGADPRFPANDGDLTAADLAEIDAAFAPAPAVEFDVEGTRYTLAQMLEANADDPEVCQWVRAARPGAFYPAIVRCQCVAAGAEPFTEEWFAEADRGYQQQKDAGFPATYDRQLWEQQQALDNVGRLWPGSAS